MAERKPGAPARGSRTGRPIMVLFDVLGRRWSLRVLWELRSAPLSFRALRAQCDDVSPTVLNTRLKELRALALIEAGPEGYGLSEDGRSLCAELMRLDVWAQGWAARLEAGDA